MRRCSTVTETTGRIATTKGWMSQEGKQKKSHFELKRLFDRSIYHRAIIFGNHITPFLKKTLATKTMTVRHIPIVI